MQCPMGYRCGHPRQSHQTFGQQPGDPSTQDVSTPEMLPWTTLTSSRPLDSTLTCPTPIPCLAHIAPYLLNHQSMLPDVMAGFPQSSPILVSSRPSQLAAGSTQPPHPPEHLSMQPNMLPGILPHCQLPQAAEQPSPILRGMISQNPTAQVKVRLSSIPSILTLKWHRGIL